jgi:hypothetical protein
VLGGRRFTTDVERVLFALVANRAVDPCSRLAAAEWASHDAAIPGLQAMDEDQAYRAMDLLIEADAQAQVQEAVFFAVADLLNLEVLGGHHKTQLVEPAERRQVRARECSVEHVEVFLDEPV